MLPERKKSLYIITVIFNFDIDQSLYLFIFPKMIHELKSLETDFAK